MKYLTFVLSACLISFVITSSSAQYYSYGGFYLCPNTDAKQFEDVRQRLSSIFEEKMSTNEMHMYTVNSRQNGDTLEAVVMMYLKDDESFEKVSAEWKERAPEAKEFLKNNCVEQVYDKLMPEPRFFPMIKYEFTDVKMIDEVNYVPDPTINYNILIDLTGYDPRPEKTGEPDYSSINFSVIEIGRFLNLHAGSGIPEDKLNVVVAVHGYATHAFMTDEAYEKRHGQPNPTKDLIRELARHNVRFIVCAQSMRGITNDELLPEAEVSFTSQAVLTEYQLKGYALKIISGE